MDPQAHAPVLSVDEILRELGQIAAEQAEVDAKIKVNVDRLVQVTSKAEGKRIVEELELLESRESALVTQKQNLRGTMQVICGTCLTLFFRSTNSHKGIFFFRL